MDATLGTGRGRGIMEGQDIHVPAQSIGTFIAPPCLHRKPDISFNLMYSSVYHQTAWLSVKRLMFLVSGWLSIMGIWKSWKWKRWKRKLETEIGNGNWKRKPETYVHTVTSTYGLMMQAVLP